MVQKNEYLDVSITSTKMIANLNMPSLLETEVLFGETVEILDENSDWFYCRLLTDNYTGWIKKNSTSKFKKKSHRVIANRTFILKYKNEKSNTITSLSIGSKVFVKNIISNWAEIILPENYKFLTGYIPHVHLVETQNKVKDWVKIAENLLETPYRWGGRNTIGIDCSALLQLSYQTYGENLPRNTADQHKIAKKIITKIVDLKRGCVVFWKGHVAIMTDKHNCIHANAYHMKTVIEPLNNIINRMGKKYPIMKMLDLN